MTTAPEFPGYSAHVQATMLKVWKDTRPVPATIPNNRKGRRAQASRRNRGEP